MDSSTAQPDNRTNVRAPRSVVAALRTAFWVLERAAPGAGSTLADRLWCTVPPAGGAGKRDHRPAAGEIITARVGSDKVVAEAWGSGPLIFLSPGWGGTRGQVGAFVSPLVAAGYRVVSFDALSHGDSDPGAMGRKRSTLSEFADSLTAVAGVAGEPYGILAHSAGCVASGLAVRDGLPVRRMAFIAPMADPVPYIDDFRRVLGVGRRIGEGMVSTLERRIGRPLSDFNLVDIVSKMNVPVLVIHDRGDRETRFADGQAVATAGANGRFVATDGLGHRRILSDAAVVTKVVEFFTEADGVAG